MSMKHVFVATVIIVGALTVSAYDDLDWKFEGSTVRIEQSANSGLQSSAFDTFVSSVKASLPLDWFSTFKSGLKLIFR